MAKPVVEFKATYANGKTLEELSRVIASRQKYLNETAFQSVHAIAVDTLKSLRPLVLVAKAAGIKVDIVQRSDLQFSYSYKNAAATGSRASASMCLRRDGVHYMPAGDERIKFQGCHSAKAAAIKVFEFVDKDASPVVRYLIAAPSQAQARKCAQHIVASRLLRYSGLAKRAISALMIKTNNKGPVDSVNFRVAAVAKRETNVVRRTATAKDGSGAFVLALYDDLRYAGRALKGGQAAVDIALRRAANKSVGLIHHKCKDLLFPGELKTPFPEITKKGAA